ncbi:hypothetical protein AC781_10715 [Akkermansia glycaniphila]|nr:hypothetical protein AC781_10715 [Akkermansia glycaniphila]
MGRQRHYLQQMIAQQAAVFGAASLVKHILMRHIPQESHTQIEAWFVAQGGAHQISSRQMKAVETFMARFRPQ